MLQTARQQLKNEFIHMMVHIVHFSPVYMHFTGDTFNMRLYVRIYFLW